MVSWVMISFAGGIEGIKILSNLGGLPALFIIGGAMLSLYKISALLQEYPSAHEMAKEENMKGNCVFRPEIHENVFKYETRKAEQVVLNPEAMNFFVNRNLAKKKNEKDWKNKVDNRPGNGSLYSNRLTIPKKFDLKTSKVDKEEFDKMEDLLPSKHKRSNSLFLDKKRITSKNFDVIVKFY